MRRIFLFGPALFTLVVAALNFLQYDFMRGLGWDPLTAVTTDWPSGLALGPYGLWMTATFISSGLILFLFALRLRADLGSFAYAPQKNTGTSQDGSGAAARFGSLLLAGSGLALAGLAFSTDPTLSSAPRTWHGYLHDLFFVMLGLTLLSAMILLGRAFRDDPRWRNLSIYTWITAGVAVPAFFLKGFAFYIFLAAFLVWTEVIALRYYFLKR